MIKVQDHRGLVRDPYSKAILSIDTSSLYEHRKNKKMLSDLYVNGNKVNELNSQVNLLKDEISEMKNILTMLLELIKK